MEYMKLRGITFEKFFSMPEIQYCHKLLEIASVDAGNRSRLDSSHRELLLHLALKRIRSKGACKILEIGTFEGLNARLLAASDSNISVTTIDVPMNQDRSSGTYAIVEHSSEWKILRERVNDWGNDHMKKRLKNVAHPRINYIESPSICLLEPRLQKEIGAVDLFFIDGDHSSPQVCIDAAAAVTAWHKDPDTIIILDDVAISEDNPSYRVVKLLIKDLGLESCLIQKTPNNNTKYIAVLSSSVLF